VPQHLLLEFDLEVYGDCHVLTYLTCFGFGGLYSLNSLSTANTCRGETDLGMNPVSKKEDAGLQALTPPTQTQNLSQRLVIEPSTDSSSYYNEIACLRFFGESSAPGCILTVLTIKIRIRYRKQVFNSTAPVSDTVMGMEAEMIPWPATEGWLSWRPIV